MCNGMNLFKFFNIMSNVFFLINLKQVWQIYQYIAKSFVDKYFGFSQDSNKLSFSFLIKNFWYLLRKADGGEGNCRVGDGKCELSI